MSEAWPASPPCGPASDSRRKLRPSGKWFERGGRAGKQVLPMEHTKSAAIRSVILALSLIGLLALFGGGSRAATTPVYDDALAGGWANWSWATVNLAAASPTHSGSASIAVTYTAGWQGLYLAYPGGFATGAFTRLRFYLHGGASGGQQIQLYAVLAGGSNGPAVTLAAPPANSWGEVEVSLADLGAAGATLTGLV